MRIFPNSGLYKLPFITQVREFKDNSRNQRILTYSKKSPLCSNLTLWVVVWYSEKKLRLFDVWQFIKCEPYQLGTWERRRKITAVTVISNWRLNWQRTRLATTSKRKSQNSRSLITSDIFSCGQFWKLSDWLKLFQSTFTWLSGLVEVSVFILCDYFSRLIKCSWFVK